MRKISDEEMRYKRRTCTGRIKRFVIEGLPEAGATRLQANLEIDSGETHTS